MGGRHHNFEDPSTWGRDIRKTKFDPLGLFSSVVTIMIVIFEDKYIIYLSDLFETILTFWFQFPIDDNLD